MKYTIAGREEWSSIEKEPFFTLCRGICHSLRKNSIPVRTVSLSGIIMDLPFSLIQVQHHGVFPVFWRMWIFDQSKYPEGCVAGRIVLCFAL